MTDFETEENAGSGKLVGGVEDALARVGYRQLPLRTASSTSSVHSSSGRETGVEDERMKGLLGEGDLLLPVANDDEEEEEEEGDGRRHPIVGVIMGSDSDLPCMSACAEKLEHFGIPFELTVVSAHRTPGRMAAYAKNARKRGIKVIVAGAGGAAHLPGMVASMTTLPVIGVPVKTSTLSGVDSLYSIVQMPRGVPVATVAIGNATNAGILAAKILAVENESLADRVALFMQNQRQEVLAKASKVETMGWKAYLAEYEEKKRRAKPKKNTAVGI
eukprot:g586.t1